MQGVLGFLISFLGIIGISYLVFTRIFGPVLGFALAMGAGALIGLGMNVYEGLTHDTNFNQFRIDGDVNISSKNQNNDKNLFTALSYNNYRLGGNINGTIY